MNMSVIVDNTFLQAVTQAMQRSIARHRGIAMLQLLIKGDKGAKYKAHSIKLGHKGNEGKAKN